MRAHCLFVFFRKFHLNKFYFVFIEETITSQPLLKINCYRETKQKNICVKFRVGPISVHSPGQTKFQFKNVVKITQS